MPVLQQVNYSAGCTPIIVISEVPLIDVFGIVIIDALGHVIII